MASEALFSALRRITDGSLTALQLVDAAEAVERESGRELVVQLYRIWIRFNPQDPLRHVIYFNLSTQLSRLGDIAGSIEALEQCLAVDANFYPARINLGSALERGGALDKALEQWSAVPAALPQINGSSIGYKLLALKQIARVLEARSLLPNAESVMRQSLDISLQQPDVLQHYGAIRLSQCKWPVLAELPGVEAGTIKAGISPLSMAAYTDDPVLHLASAWSYGKTFVKYPALTDVFPAREPPGDETPRRLRIGYVSSDLRDHAVGFMMAEVFEFHDRGGFEVFAYYCGIPSAVPLHERYKGVVDHWLDATGMSDADLARRIRTDEIDILVDVNGYTRDSRTPVFALLPAPVIVNWLGYPGTMGTPYHHYIVADEWIIPPEYEIYYTEKVLRLPCYQPNDRKREVSSKRFARSDVGLPDGKFVYCCFNGTQKISRETFERWLAILKRVPESVLWLLDNGEGTNQRLVDYAEARGVDRGRLVFAPKMINSEHLTRYLLADLFLDTAPYGAHVTSADALWMGVPVLTVSGRGFASRVCGSLVRAAGLPEMICATPQEFIERAVALAAAPDELGRLKETLARNRDSCVLFDSAGLVRHLEQLYREMWTDYRAGRLPRPDLTNLDVYLEIAVGIDHEAFDGFAIDDFAAWYREQIGRRHRYVAIGPDKRLWTEAARAAAGR